MQKPNDVSQSNGPSSSSSSPSRTAGTSDDLLIVAIQTIDAKMDRLLALAEEGVRVVKIVERKFDSHRGEVNADLQSLQHKFKQVVQAFVNDPSDNDNDQSHLGEETELKLKRSGLPSRVVDESRAGTDRRQHGIGRATPEAPPADDHRRRRQDAARVSPRPKSSSSALYEPQRVRETDGVIAVDEGPVSRKPQWVARRAPEGDDYDEEEEEEVFVDSATVRHQRRLVEGSSHRRGENVRASNPRYLPEPEARVDANQYEALFFGEDEGTIVPVKQPKDARGVYAVHTRHRRR